MEGETTPGAAGLQAFSKFCYGDNELFGSLRRDGFRIHFRKTPEVEKALFGLLPDPDRWFAEAEIFKPGTRTHAGRIEVEGRSYFLKRYNCRGLWYRLRHFFKRSRAIRTWGISWGLVDRGVPIPEPLICLEERRLGLLGRSYILMEFSAKGKKIKDLWPQLDQQEKRDCLEKIARTLGSMHGKGCLHGDLKWDNLLIEHDSKGWHLTIVDLDGSHLSGRFNNNRANKDLNRFLRDLRKYEDCPETETDFLDHWNACRRAH